MKRLLPFLTFLLPALAAAQPSSYEERQRTFGSVVAPAALPSGAMAFYGFAGVPDVGAGFRQGTSIVELEARARVNYLLLSLALEVATRRIVIDTGDFTLAPSLALGLVFGTGSTYFDESNFAAVSFRILPGVVASWPAGETVRVLGLVDLPIDLAFSPSGSQRVKLLAGGGLELYLGQDVSLLAAAQLGPEFVKQALAVTETRVGYQLRLGLGFRIF